LEPAIDGLWGKGYVDRRFFERDPHYIQKLGVSMSVKVGINGFGRIGRLVFRAAIENP
jgi:lactate dehydrogenase-like 2-hydroxyacid dehydrogenase